MSTLPSNESYGCPLGVRWLIFYSNEALFRAIRALGPQRVKWAGSQHHFAHDSAWLLDGEPAPLARIYRVSPYV